MRKPINYVAAINVSLKRESIRISPSKDCGSRLSQPRAGRALRETHGRICPGTGWDSPAPRSVSAQLGFESLTCHRGGKKKN